MTRLALTIACALSMIPRISAADAPSPTPWQLAEGQLAPPSHPKRRVTAYALALGGLAVSGSILVASSTLGKDHRSLADGLDVVGLAGIVLAPSFGHFYAHDPITGGLLLRIGGGALASVGLLKAFDSSLSLQQQGTDEGLALVFVGAGVVVAGAIWDLATTGSAVEDWNVEHQIHLAPVAIATPRGTAGGLGLTGRF